MTYTDEFLISELHRFVKEKGFVPTTRDMNIKNGYPSRGTYQKYFGSFNNALIKAGLKINQFHPKLNGAETCSYCGKKADEIVGFNNWYYDENYNNKRYCNRCRPPKSMSDYVNGNLDINSTTGRGRAGEITVIKALKIGDEHDCALISMGFPFDMYNEEYKKINVKTSVFSNDYNKWNFNFKAEKIADTYICIAMSLDTKQVEHVWIVPNEGKIRDLTGFPIYNGNLSLRNNKHWEVDVKIYNDAWQDMLKNYADDKCKVFSKKNKL